MADGYDMAHAEPEVVRFEGAQGLELVAGVAGDPAGQAVVMFHGGGQTRHSWGGTMRELVRRGAHVVSVDLRGHGESEWSPERDYRPDAFAGDVEAVASQFDSPVLVGASLGGTSALLAVHRAESPLARALVLVDVAPRIEVSGVDRITAFMLEHADEGFGSLDEVADWIQSYTPNRPRPTNLDGLAKNVRLRDGRWYWHWDPAFMRMGDELRTDESTDLSETGGFGPYAERLERAARSLVVPTLLVRGRQSDLLSVEGAQRFLEVVPHAEFVDVAGAGHMVAGDRNDRFTDAVVEFLERLD